MPGPQSIVKLFEMTWNNSNNDRFYDRIIVFMSFLLTNKHHAQERLYFLDLIFGELLKEEIRPEKLPVGRFRHGGFNVFMV